MRRRAADFPPGPMPEGAAPAKLALARAMRRSPTAAESALWSALRRRGLRGLKFRRQHVLAGYVVDFYCPFLRLAVEVDGVVHELRREADRQRAAALARLGVRIVRVRNQQVLADLRGALAAIRRACRGSTTVAVPGPPSPPAPDAGAGPGVGADGQCVPTGPVSTAAGTDFSP